MEVDKKLYEDIKEYCKLNGIKPAEYANNLLRKAFMEDKYGLSPFRKASEPEGMTAALKEAVDNEIRRILNDPEELREAIGRSDREGFAGCLEELTDVTRKSKDTPPDGMNDDGSVGKAVADYMEKHGIGTENAPENVAKKDEISDKTDDSPKRTRKRQINVK